MTEMNRANFAVESLQDQNDKNCVLCVAITMAHALHLFSSLLTYVLYFSDDMFSYCVIQNVLIVKTLGFRPWEDFIVHILCNCIVDTCYTVLGSKLSRHF